MKRPSIFNGTETLQENPGAMDQDMLKKLQNMPAFVHMMNQQEELRISKLSPKEKLRERLKQKQQKRSSQRVKESAAANEETKHRKTKPNVPSPSVDYT